MIVAKSPPSKFVLPGPPGKSVSPVKSSGVFFEREADAARACGRACAPCAGAGGRLVHGVVIEQVVVAGQHAGVLVANPHVDAGFAHRFDRADVVPVAVGLEH